MPKVWMISSGIPQFRQSDGSYKVVAKASDHENVDGRYEAQIFYYDAQGQRKFVQKSFAEYSTGKPNVPDRQIFQLM